MHQLDEEVVRPEDVAKLRSGGKRLRVLPEPQPGLHFAARAAGSGDEAFRILRQQLPVHAGLAEISLQRRQRRQPKQVVHALGRLGEQCHVRIGAGAGYVVIPLGRGAPQHGLLVAPVLGRDVGLDPDDRLDPGCLRLRPEVKGAVDVAVVGDGDRRHAHPGALGEQVGEPGRPVQHGVLGMDVQVHERVRVPGVTSPSSNAAGGPARWHGAPPPSGMLPQAWPAHLRLRGRPAALLTAGTWGWVPPTLSPACDSRGG